MKLDLITNKQELQNGVNPNDEFYTPNYAIEPLLKYLKPNSNVWCPFDTEESNFCKMLVANGHTVRSSHISNGVDFFSFAKDNLNGVEYIISNPPYSIKAEVFERLFELKIPFAMLVGVVGLFESQKRFTMFKNNDFEIMYFNKRISYFKDYTEQKPSLNPPFSSVYLCQNVLPDRIVFETINPRGGGNLKFSFTE
jgi:hypothetical protein